MPTRIKLQDGEYRLVEDPFTTIGDDAGLPPGDVIISLTRFQTEGDQLLSEGRKVGVRLEPAEEVEALVYDLPRIALVAVVFPKYRDGRSYTAARLLRERYGFEREIRAVGEVLREQAGFMARVGIDAFSPADGSTPEDWARATHRQRHVYQRAADRRTPAFAERE
ncbi:DUF934 domain-containing protein [Phenylobacterium sp. Root700]|uniref:DUF934 domain-containing protein n=1 Tax=Phenylobacterium sp. Root700 TaxID=1736591 RepID=UPI0006F66F65|nr:DUF934 domain-containing protein [Phenylobacterium sp. Root700]KRB49682.1 oxidoreductase [Phenylobacterium sp. Root700]